MRSSSIRTPKLFLLTAATAVGQELQRGPLSGALTPAILDERLDAVARRLQDRDQTAARFIEYDIGFPQDRAEFDKLGRHVIVLLSAVTRDPAEIPLRRVYAVVGGTEVALTRIASIRRDVPKTALVHRMVGPYREDGFYLAPGDVMVKDGFIMADFAVNRTGFHLFRLPADAAPAWLRPTDRPRPGAKVDQAALDALIEREYPGFPKPRAPH